MQASHTSHNGHAGDGELWTMKDAAKAVGVGLPALYERLREKGLFTRLGIDGRNMPIRRLQEEGLFTVQNSAWWDAACGTYRPCPKVKATYKGLILLQEIADEVARDKEKPAGKRAGAHHRDDDVPGPGEVVRHQPDENPDSDHR